MSEPLSFLHVTTFYPPYSFGGDGAYVHRLAHALADAGHRVDVVHSIDAYHLFHPDEPTVEWPSHERVTTHGLRTRTKWLTLIAAHQTGYPIFHLKEIQSILAGGRYDVIHFHNVSLFGPGVLSLEPPGRRPLKVYTTHEHWLICPTHVLWKYNSRPCERPECLTCVVRAGRPPQLWRYTGALGRAAASVDLFLAPSQFTAEMHARRGFGGRFDVLPLFVDVDADDWRRAPRPHERPYYLFVGRLERLKGADTLVRAMAAVPEVDLLIAGSGSEEDRLKTMASSLTSRVRFLGDVPQRDLGPLYGHALACCIPSLTFEVFPTVAIESMARGTPVIAHDLGGLTEIVEQSGGGVLYRTDEELIDALRRVAGEPSLRASLGERGRRAAASLWSKQAHLTRYFTLLDRAGASRASRTAS